MGRLTGKKILMVVGQTNYDNQEYEFLSDLFLGEGGQVSVASPENGKALGRSGGFAVPQVTISQARAEETDAIVLIGGYGAYTFLWDDPVLHDLVRQARDLNKIIAAASLSVVTLANAGILDGKKATSYPDYNAAVILSEKGANHVYQSVVADDNIITSNHPRKVQELGEVIISKLTGDHE